jgi:FkbM family methyltransferase
MSARLKRSVKSFLRRFDVVVTRQSTLDQLVVNARAVADIEFLLALPNAHASKLLAALPFSKSQLRQDLFVLSHLDFKRHGFFVEFGATNGVDLSNSYLLETRFDWTGILAEPAKCWHKDLRRNRKAIVDPRCVWKNSGSTLSFNEVEFAELSTINEYSATDFHKEAREHGTSYDVQTISLGDLLAEHCAPKTIDYLSIDTEGSEFEILNSFDFAKHDFNVITCEHNFTSMREEIYRLLTAHGYQRVFENLSRYDDWYTMSN